MDARPAAKNPSKESSLSAWTLHVAVELSMLCKSDMLCRFNSTLGSLSSRGLVTESSGCHGSNMADALQVTTPSP